MVGADSGALLCCSTQGYHVPGLLESHRGVLAKIEVPLVMLRLWPLVTVWQRSAGWSPGWDAHLAGEGRGGDYSSGEGLRFGQCVLQVPCLALSPPPAPFHSHFVSRYHRPCNLIAVRWPHCPKPPPPHVALQPAPNRLPRPQLPSRGPSSQATPTPTRVPPNGPRAPCSH